MYKVHLYKYKDKIIFEGKQFEMGRVGRASQMIANKYKIFNTEIIIEEIKKIYDITHLKSDCSVDYIKNDDMCFPCKTITIQKHSYTVMREELDKKINITTPEGIKINFTHKLKTKCMK
jgi:hypothetical protein